MADNKEDNAIWERLRFLVDKSGLTDQDFAERVNIDRSQFGRILKGKINITLKQVMEISSQFGAREGWIITGEEPVYKTNKPDSSTKSDLHALLTQEIEKMRLSLDKLWQVASVLSGAESIMKAPVEDLPWGKTNETDHKKQNRKVGKDI